MAENKRVFHTGLGELGNLLFIWLRLRFWKCDYRAIYFSYLFLHSLKVFSKVCFKMLACFRYVENKASFGQCLSHNIRERGREREKEGGREEEEERERE